MADESIGRSPGPRLPRDVRIVNIGLDLLAESIRAQGRDVVSIDWRIPAKGDEESIDALERLMGRHADRIDRANAEVYRRLDTATPLLTGVERALDVIPGMTDHSILHCGPPLGWDEFCDPLRRSVLAAVLAEGWASDRDGADDLVTSGRVTLDAANHHATVVPMATAMGPSAPVFVVGFDDCHAFSPLNQGPGKTAWFGVDAPEAVDRLKWLADTAQPILAAAIASSGPIDVFGMAAQGIHMGDDLHMRTQATGNLLLRYLLADLIGTGNPRLGEFAQFWSSNHLFFLNIAMAAAKATTMWAAEVPDSSIVVTMARNGTTFGIQVAGAGTDWFIAPAPPVEHAMYYSGFGPETSAPDIGDSAILELIGLGGPAAAGAPAVAAFVGGTMAAARAVTDQMAHISTGRSSRFTLPTLDYVGTPIGVDIRKVVELQITPSINTGILHRSAGTGQVGAGVAVAPVDAFRDAVLALDRRLT
ncbi:MAG: DUF1116 domain-containing protein [Acidimicrobiia bacterium]|nr:DUF1116 domain-containing protein [Acidimicrobiia bacterium]